MTLESRVEKAKQLTIVEIPNSPTATFGTWGSGDDYYFISLFRSKDSGRTIQVNRRQVELEKINVACLKDGGLFGEACDCPGNSKHTICYHTIGALTFALEQRGQEIEFCRNDIVAQGKVAHSEWDRNVNTYHFALIQSKQGRGSMWAVIRDRVKVVDHGDMDQRISSMRGSEAEEEGID